MMLIAVLGLNAANSWVNRAYADACLDILLGCYLLAAWIIASTVGVLSLAGLVGVAIITILYYLLWWGIQSRDEAN